MISFKNLLLATAILFVVGTFSMSGDDKGEVKTDELPVPKHISEILAATEKILLAADERMELESRKFSILVIPKIREKEKNSWAVRVQPLPARPGGHTWIDLEDSGEILFTGSIP